MCVVGASGAGKTTLLDVLASRVTMGVVCTYFRAPHCWFRAVFRSFKQDPRIIGLERTVLQLSSYLRTEMLTLIS